MELKDAVNPHDVPDILFKTAARYREDAAVLRTAWQDENAGRVWDALAKELEKAASRCEIAIARNFV